MAGKPVQPEPYRAIPPGSFSGRMELLPPSFFVSKKTTASEAEVTGGKGASDLLLELQTLREENRELRLQAAKGTSQSDSRQPNDAASLVGGPSVCSAVPLTEHVRAKTQFQECIDLLKTENSAHCDRIVQLEKFRVKEREQLEFRRQEQVCALTDAQHSLEEELKRVQNERVAILEGKDREILHLRAQFEEERTQTMTQLEEMQSLLAEKDRCIQNLQQEKEEATGNLGKELTSSKSQLLLKEQDISTLVEEAQTTRQSHCLQMEDCLRQLANFRTYLGMDRPPLEGQFYWQSEREKLTEQNGNLHRECQALCKEVELLNTRLSAIGRILALQEAELAKSAQTPERCRVAQQVDQSGNQHQLLLTRWREKVFALMVQLKSSDITQQELQRQFTQEKAKLVENIDRLEHDKNLLACAIEDRTAELQMEKEKCKNSQQQIRHLLKETSQLEGRCEQFQAQFEGLANLLLQIPAMSDQHKETLQHFVTRLLGYERRLDFAHKRLQTFRALLKKPLLVAKRQSLKTATLSTQTGNDCETPLSDSSDLTSLPKDTLVAELQRIMVERKQLIDRVTALTEESALKENQLRNDFEARMSALQQQLQSAQDDRDSWSSRCEEGTAKWAHVESSRSELQHECAHLQEEVSNLRTQFQRSIDKAVAEERLKAKEDFAEMELRLNKARREHTKMALSLQQTKRDADRERERVMQALELERESFKVEMEACKNKLASVTAEKNLLTVASQGMQSSAGPTLSEYGPHSSPRALGLHLAAPQVGRDEEGSVCSSGSTSGSRGTYVLSQGSSTPLLSEEDPLGQEPSLTPPTAWDDANGRHLSGPTLDETGQQDLYSALQELQKLSSDILRLEGRSAD